MPFTFSHPAIILPLKQAKAHWFSLTGLVAGSVAPDFEYFLKVHATSTVSETLPGIFTFNLPAAVGISLVFHQIIKKPLIRHLPKPYDRRFSGFLNFNFLKYFKKHPFRFLSSALIGVISHLGLDILTSPDSMSRSFQRLRQTEVSDKLLQLEASLGEQPFLLLERSFSVVGLALIAYLLTQINCPDKNFLRESTRQKSRFYMLFSGLLAAGIWASIKFLPYGTAFPQLVVNFISAGMLSLLVTSLLFRR